MREIVESSRIHRHTHAARAHGEAYCEGSSQREREKATMRASRGERNRKRRRESEESWCSENGRVESIPPASVCICTRRRVYKCESGGGSTRKRFKRERENEICAREERINFASAFGYARLIGSPMITTPMRDCSFITRRATKGIRKIPFKTFIVYI